MEIVNKETVDLSKEPEVMEMADADSIYRPSKPFSDYHEEETSTERRLLGAMQGFGQGIEKLKVAPELMWGQMNVAYGKMNKFVGSSLGGKLGNAMVKGGEDDIRRGTLQMKTATIEYDELRKEQEKRQIPLAKEDVESATYNLTATGLDYASCMAAALFGPVVGLGAMGARMAGSTAVEGTEQALQEAGNVEGAVQNQVEKAGGELVLNVLKTTANTAEELFLGAPAQVRTLFKAGAKRALQKGAKANIIAATKDIGAGVLKGGAMEFAEEGIVQNISDNLFDYALGRIKDDKELVDSIEQGVVGGVYSSVFGGSFGGVGAIYSRAKAINGMTKALSPLMPEEEAREVSKVIVNNKIQELSDVVAVSANMSAQLQAKRGDVFDAMKKASFEAIQNSGGYEGMDEQQKWEHATDVATRFSDEVVGEAIKRKVPVQEVINSKDIVFENGELRLAPVKEKENAIDKNKEKQKGSQESEIEGFVLEKDGEEDELSYNNYLRDAIDDVATELSRKFYNIDFLDLLEEVYPQNFSWEEYQKEAGSEKETFEDLGRSLLGEESDADFGEYGYNYFLDEVWRRYYDKKNGRETLNLFENLPMQKESKSFSADFLRELLPKITDLEIEEKQKSIKAAKEKKGKKRVKKTNKKDDKFYQIAKETADLAEENERLDNIYPEYKGETININGKERTVYNSEGNRIAKSEEALRNFYKWFGDSKVVDEEGRPRVMHHGTRQRGISEFKSKYGDRLIFFAYNRDFSEDWAKNAYRTEEQEEKARKLSEERQEKRKEINERYLKDYGEGWSSDDGIVYSATEELNIWQKEREEGLGIAPIVMDVYLKAKKTFDPSKDWEQVLPELIKSNGFSEEETKASSQEDIKKAEEEYERKVAELDKLEIEADVKPGSEEWKKHTKEYDRLYQELQAVRDKGKSFQQHLNRIKDGAWVYFEREAVMNKIRKLGYDSIKLKELSDGEDTTLAVFEGNNQIKSTDNRGTYSLEDENIFNQTAYAGSRVDYDKPSLEAIGSGEGNQAHGWGLYYALNKDVAEDYRKMFIGDDATIEYKGKKYTKEENENEYLALEAMRDSESKEEALDYLNGTIRHLKRRMLQVTDQEAKERLQSTLKKTQEQLEFVKKADFEDISKGQVHEVDIPEMPELIDEQKTFEEQPEKVKETLKKLSDQYKGFGQLAESIKNNEDGSSLYKAFGKDVFYEKEGIEGGTAETQKYASKELKNAGIKGITYDGRRDGRCFVIFDPKDVQVVQKFYQKGKKQATRGLYDANNKVIKLFEKANTSTLPHELSHYWLDSMFDYVLSGNASPDYLSQFEVVKQFLGIGDKQKKLTRDQQELFATSYEKYIWNGEFAESAMGNVFAGYEKWLRRVYDSLLDIKKNGKTQVKITPEIIKFFDSMVTGGVSESAETQEAIENARTEEAKALDEELTKEAKEVAETERERLEMPRQKNAFKPVKTEGTEKESSYYKRTKGVVGEEDVLSYNAMKVADEMEKAEKLWTDDENKAKEILDNANPDEGYLRSALYIEQQRRALENGDTDAYLRSVRQQSEEATRMGQELSAMRGVVEDIFAPAYWIRQAEMEALKHLAKKNSTLAPTEEGISPLQAFQQALNEDIKALTAEVNSKESQAERQKALKEGVESLQKKYSGLEQEEVPDVFFQSDVDEEFVSDTVKRYIGLRLKKSDAEAIIKASEDLKKLGRERDEFGLPRDEFFVKKAELQNIVDSHAPSSRMKVLNSIVLRGNLLTASPTSVLNVFSNLENFALQKVLRAIENKRTGKTNDDIVSDDLIKGYRQRVKDIFFATGDDVAMMNDINDKRLYKGENITHSQGAGSIRALGRFYEKWVFQRLISSPDVYFKSMRAFTDFLGNEATNIAYKEGLTGENAQKRADELFKDACRIEPETAKGRRIRRKAQADALIVTFQQDTALASGLLRLRETINKLTGDIGLGDIIAMFVKTPATVKSMAFDATVGPFAHPKNLIGAINDIRSGSIKTSARLRDVIKQTTNMGLSYAIVTMLLSLLIDDDDYIPDYAQLSQAERRAIMERGGAFGSVKIGDKYFSTEYFGQLEMPLVALLNARKQQGLLDMASAVTSTIARQLADLPVIKEAAEKVEALQELGADPTGAWEYAYDEIGDMFASRTVPNLFASIAKIADEYERETSGDILKKIQAKIPVARELLQPKVSSITGKPVKTQPELMQILFGSRGKEADDDKVVKEIYDLVMSGEKITLTDITKTKAFKGLPDETKTLVREYFGKQFYNKAKRIVNKATKPEVKAEKLADARREATKRTKEKFGKEVRRLQKEKR